MLNFIKKIKARRMNKIVEEVARQIEEKMDFLFDDFVSKMNGQLQNMEVPEIDYNEVAYRLDYSQIAYYADTEEIADYFSVEELAGNIDVSDIAGYVDTDDIAQHFDHYTLAQEIELSDVSEYIDLDDLMDDVRRDVLGEVDGMIEDALDSLKITRG